MMESESLNLWQETLGDGGAGESAAAIIVFSSVREWVGCRSMHPVSVTFYRGCFFRLYRDFKIRATSTYTRGSSRVSKSLFHLRHAASQAVRKRLPGNLGANFISFKGDEHSEFKRTVRFWMSLKHRPGAGNTLEIGINYDRDVPADHPEFKHHTCRIEKC